MKKILVLILASLAVILPAAFAIDHLGSEAQIMSELEVRERQIKEEIKNEDDPDVKAELEQKVETLHIFRKLIDIKHKMDAAIREDDQERLAQLHEESQELQKQITELAGDRVVNATIYPDGADPPSGAQSMPQPAVLNG